jgi:hypothetical protein
MLDFYLAYMPLAGVRDHGETHDDWPGNLTAVRLTEFWRRMDEQFGEVYAQSVAKDFVLAGLGDRMVKQALEDGEEVVWLRAIR